ncbi:hypothetical protein AB0C04_28105 [Micromonospora sp. NPDC048909]|uniref:hypothetical protein n=1 Tax=Micromonospora sp. NPDC048909 TaxID=3155643 RepID=UPI0033F63969
MSDETKGVTVYGTRSGHTQTLKYPNASSVDVRDGHLFVLGSISPTDVVAVFSPDKWFSVDVK